MALNEDLKNLKFDTRMTDLNLNRKVITKADIQKHLSSLADSSDLAQPLLSEEDSAEDKTNPA